MGLCRIHDILTGAAAGAAIDGMVQNRLSVAAVVDQQVGREHILPGAVKEGYLSPTVGTGQPDLTCFL